MTRRGLHPDGVPWKLHTERRHRRPQLRRQLPGPLGQYREDPRQLHLQVQERPRLQGRGEGPFNLSIPFMRI